MKLFLLSLFLVLSFAGCSNSGQNPNPSTSATEHHEAHDEHDHGEHGDDEHHGGHHHTPPHGGGLTALGEEVAHLEIVLNAESGEVHLYLLDGSAENGVSSEGQGQVTLQLTAPLESPLELSPVADPLTGETAENTSHFKGQLDSLKAQKALQGTIAEVTIKGQAFKDVPVRYPEGIPEE